MEMYKRAYEKPETEVVEMKVQGQLLDASTPGGGSTGNDAPEYNPDF